MNFEDVYFTYLVYGFVGQHRVNNRDLIFNPPINYILV